MSRNLRIVVSAISGITVAAFVGGFAIGADGSGHGLRNRLWDIFMIPGGASLSLSHGGASPPVKFLLGGGGPGPAAIQMTLVSLAVWAILIGALVFLYLRARAT